jgi:hypothetical protein
MLYRIVLLVALLASSAAPAQDLTKRGAPGGAPLQGTQSEEEACRRDSVTYCREAAAVNDTFRVLACLQQNSKRISNACREVLQAHGQLPR